ncbi:MAG: transcription antitermination factor NusB [Pseudomonadota bacterium]
MTPSDSKLRSAARYFAVQALFQMEASSQALETVREQFWTHRFGEVFEDEGEMSEANVELFDALLSGAVTHQAQIDQMTNRALDAKWPIDRIDPTLRAIFRAAGAELVAKATPPKVVITEFVEIAAAFFDTGKERSFANAVLDAMARETHPNAF